MNDSDATTSSPAIFASERGAFTPDQPLTPDQKSAASEINNPMMPIDSRTSATPARNTSPAPIQATEARRPSSPSARASRASGNTAARLTTPM